MRLFVVLPNDIEAMVPTDPGNSAIDLSSHSFVISNTPDALAASANQM